MNERDAKIVQYLNDAYATERRLEIALQGHIAMTPRADYKTRLREHLKETKTHARLVARRIKALGGEAETVSLPGPDAVVKGATGAKAAVQRAAAVVQGPLHAVRGTGQQERMLKNARTEYQDEAEEIATYRVIEALAKAVGDKETAKLARDIGREEKKMSDFLVGVIDQLALDVVHDEGPSVRDRRRPRCAPDRVAAADDTASEGLDVARQADGLALPDDDRRERRASPRRAPTPSRLRVPSAKPAARSSNSKPATRAKSASRRPPSAASAPPPARPCPNRARPPGSGTRSGRGERARARLGDDVARAELGAALAHVRWRVTSPPQSRWRTTRGRPVSAG
jgi:ferritin-like metal-binding protein YciE